MKSLLMAAVALIPICSSFSAPQPTRSIQMAQTGAKGLLDGAEIFNMQKSVPREHFDTYDLASQSGPGFPRSFYEVGIETTWCNGPCKSPVYVLILQNQGSVYYHGIANTKKGYFTGEDGGNLQLISQLLDTMDIQSYADRYTVDVTSQQTTLIYINTGSSIKVIDDSSFLTPFKLQLLEELIANSINGVKLKRHDWSKEKR